MSVGGTNNISNLSLLCESCHSKIHNLDLVSHKVLQKKGIERAKENGIHMGRPKLEITQEQKTNFSHYYYDWKNKKISALEFMRLLNLNKSTFYKHIKNLEELLIQNVS